MDAVALRSRRRRREGQPATAVVRFDHEDATEAQLLERIERIQVDDP